MKKLYIFYLLTGIIVLGWAGNAKGQTAGNDNIYIDDENITLNRDMVTVDFNVVFDNYKRFRNKQVLITPVVVENSTGQTYELPKMVFEGRRRAKINRRIEALKKEPVIMGDIYSRTVVKESPYSDRVHYTHTFPYESWMRNGSIEILSDNCGCGLDSELNSYTAGNIPVARPQFNPEIYFIMPPAEIVKERTETRSAYVTFVVARHNILPGFGNNAAELAKIRESIEYVQNESSVDIKSIVIRAYASPEGSDHSNLLLSQRRAAALSDYVKTNFNIPANLLNSEGMGEDWDGLLKLVENDRGMEYRQEVLDILRNFTIEQGREQKLMALEGGKPYRYLLQTHYPALRRSDYSISYIVDGFDVAQAREVFRTHPERLSLQEMFMLAHTYEKGSREFNSIFETAARTFPEDKIANLNAAAASLYRGDLDTAQNILEKYADDPDAWNNLGVLYLKKNDFEKAESYFKKAVQRGVKEAERNLKRLE